MRVQTESSSGFADYGQDSVKRLGKFAIEQMKNTGKYDKVMEAIAAKEGIAKETIDVTDTDLFTTAISAFIEQKLKPKLVAENVIKKITNFNTRGANALKIPVRNALITASDLPDAGTVTYDTGSYTSTTITLTYKYAAQRLTHEIIQFGNVDLMAEELGQIGDAIARKVDSDIISAMQTATTTANGNRTVMTTLSGTTVTFNSLVTVVNSARQNYAEPDVILMNPSTYATLMQLDEFSGGNSITGAISFKGGDTEAFPNFNLVLGMRVVLSTQVDDDDIYLIDTARTGYYVESSNGMEVFDGRISGAVAFEVIGVLNYGVGVVQPGSIYRLEENA